MTESEKIKDWREEWKREEWKTKENNMRLREKNEKRMKRKMSVNKKWQEEWEKWKRKNKNGMKTKNDKGMKRGMINEGWKKSQKSFENDVKIGKGKLRKKNKNVKSDKRI